MSLLLVHHHLLSQEQVMTQLHYDSTDAYHRGIVQKSVKSELEWSTYNSEVLDVDQYQLKHTLDIFMALLFGSQSRHRCDSIHQTGTKYRSNNAGDGPEKTRDRKNWFPRFKSNWLGTYRSKQMFHCCECAVDEHQNARYKGAEGKHCICGKDQWHLAKTVEENEYNRRMEISKAMGGMRYDEALQRLKSMGASETDITRLRCESEESSSGNISDSTDNYTFANQHHVKTEPTSGDAPRSTSPATRAYSYNGSVDHGYEPITVSASQSSAHGTYTSLHGDYMGADPMYDHLAPAPFSEEEQQFGEMLQGILEDDPRGQPSQGSSHHQVHLAKFPSSAPPTSFGYSTTTTMTQPRPQYPVTPSTLPPPPVGEVDFEYFSEGNGRGVGPAYYHTYMHQQHPLVSSYGRPHSHQPAMIPITSSVDPVSSFSSVV